jgi:hypothetical protein
MLRLHLTPHEYLHLRYSECRVPIWLRWAVVGLNTRGPHSPDAGMVYDRQYRACRTGVRSTPFVLPIQRVTSSPFQHKPLGSEDTVDAGFFRDWITAPGIPLNIGHEDPRANVASTLRPTRIIFNDLQNRQDHLNTKLTQRPR